MLSMSSRPLGTIDPVMSPGSRSDVPWMRWKVPPTLRASTWARSVLPTPGMSSISRCPPDSSVATATSATSCLPAITESTVATSRAPSPATSAPFGASPDVMCDVSMDGSVHESVRVMVGGGSVSTTSYRHRSGSS
jgi:hypothetical protein